MELSVNFLTLHREPVRHGYFRAHAARDPFFDPVAKAWIVTNPAQCRHLISSSELHPASYEEDYRALNERLGIDFPGLRFAFSHIPLCLHGDRHVRSRRRASEFLAARRPMMSAQIPELIARHFGRLARAGRLELMADVIVPLVHDVISLIVGTDIGSELECRNASVVFDKSIGVTKRRRIDAEIAKLRETIASHLGEDSDEEDTGLRLAFLILGKDALTGTLGESLHRVLEDNPGQRLSDIDYPELPPETGVPYIERHVTAPFEFAGCNFAQGERVRIFLQSFAYQDQEASRTNFFGAGAHACLGRPLSLEIWKGIAAFLSTIPLRASLLTHVPRTSDYVFTCPEQLQVELSG